MRIFQYEYGISKGYTCPNCNAFCDFTMGQSVFLDMSKYSGIKCGRCGHDMTEVVYGKRNNIKPQQ